MPAITPSAPPTPSTTPLTSLPPELLDLIIAHSLPRTFENLATVNKALYARCTPFLARHNALRSQYHSFAYDAHTCDTPAAASDLLALIASNPLVARYIRSAILLDDSRFLAHLRARGHAPKAAPRIADGGAMVRLFAESTHLARAGLDWRDFYARFAADVAEMRYSQNGSVFLLTLLRDAESLVVPRDWEQDGATSRLLDVLVGEARGGRELASGLRCVSSVAGSLSVSEREKCGLSWARPFLALPDLKSFSAPGSFAVGATPTSLAFGVSPRVADALEVAHLCGCCIDAAGISNFLKHTPRLKTLQYSHSTQHDHLPADWDICEFINAVAREAGDHLIALSVTILDLRGRILPGRASIRSFQRLKKLEFPLDLVMCNINAAGFTGTITTSLQRVFNSGQNPFVRDLVPASVKHLSLRSMGMGPRDVALDALFGHFRTVRRAQLPQLQEMHIACKQEADEVYKMQCNRIVAEGEREGVVVHLQAYEYSGGIDWEK
jgi:hypothetical protein